MNVPLLHGEVIGGKLFMAETKRVLILAVRFGSGHWQAALALKKALVEAYPATEVDVVNYLAFAGWIFDVLTRLIYHDLMIRVPPLHRRFFNYTDRLTQDSLLQKWIKTLGAPAFLLYLKRKTPDLIISTFPVPAAVVSWLKQHGLVNCPMVTVITDYTLHRMWIQPETDLYIAPNQAVAEELVWRGVLPEQVAATGIPIDPRFAGNVTRALSDLLPDLTEALRGLPLVLVISGATSFGGELGRICRMLAEFPVPHVAAVLGVRWPKLRLNLRRAVSRGPNRVFIIGYTREVPLFMAAASCLISKAGGITVSEALAAEVPLIIYRALPCQEERNRDFLVREGMALSARSMTELAQQLGSVLQDGSLSARMQDAAARLKRPDSAAAAVRFIAPYLGLPGSTCRRSHVDSLNTGTLTGGTSCDRGEAPPAASTWSAPGSLNPVLPDAAGLLRLQPGGDHGAE
jgi:processive 1,2-diacylglycerol beta-glucosyltransferase